MREYDTPLALRHRSRWEALDAGILLWRDNFAYLLIFFALPLWLCAFGLRIIPERLRYLSWIFLWLLRPLFERPALHVISVRFFEKGAGLKRLCSGLFKTITRGLAADLSWRRFSPVRAAMMPVRTLEGLKFKQIAERRKILKKGGLGFCSVLTAWSIIMELILLGGEFLLLLITLEILQPGLFSTVEEIVDGWEIFIYAAFCVNSMLIGSLYVCMGFSLYLNCRVELEGWDLEILFRGLAEKNRHKNPARTAALIFLAAALLLPARSAVTQENPPGASGAENAAVNAFVFHDDIPLETLQKILDSPDFGGERDGWGIRLKQKDKEKKQPELNLNFSPLLEKIKQFFALMLRSVLIGIAVILAIVLFIYIRRHSGGRSLFKKSGTARAISGAGGISPQALLEQSQEFFRRGELRQAWGLCIAALFRSLAVYRNMVFPPDATEYECLSAARAAADYAALAVPVNYWIAFAYAGRLPPHDSYQQAVAYCAGLAEAALEAAPDERQAARSGIARNGAAHE